MNYTALQSETDCDGTTFWAKRYATKEEAEASSDTYEVMLEAHFVCTEQFHNLDEWERAYYRRVGYCSLGARWNPWAGPNGDDTIGIPALDTRYDDPIYSDDDIEMMQMGT